jgi:hypothetical protein
MMERFLVTEEEQARLLHCSVGHLKNLRYKRLVPFVRIGRWIRYNPLKVAAAIERFTVKERV